MQKYLHKKIIRTALLYALSIFYICHICKIAQYYIFTQIYHFHATYHIIITEQHCSDYLISRIGLFRMLFIQKPDQNTTTAVGLYT